LPFGKYHVLIAHGEPTNCLIDGRKNACRYFTRLAQEHPEQPLYAEIAGQFGVIAEIILKKMYKAMNSTATHGYECGEKQKKAVAQLKTRQEIAGHIDEMKAADEKALALMKKLLAVLGREGAS